MDGLSNLHSSLCNKKVPFCVLYCIALYCIILYCIVFCIVLKLQTIFGLAATSANYNFSSEPNNNGTIKVNRTTCSQDGSGLLPHVPRAHPHLPAGLQGIPAPNVFVRFGHNEVGHCERQFSQCIKLLHKNKYSAFFETRQGVTFCLNNVIFWGVQEKNIV